MNKTGNHVVEMQETEEYKSGWAQADLGFERPVSIYNHKAKTYEDWLCCKGWDAYHAQERTS